MEDKPVEMLPLLIEAFARTQDCVGVFDAQDRLVYCNPSLATMFGKSQLIATNQTFEQLIEYCFLHNEGVIVETTDLAQWLAKANQRRRSIDFRRFDVDLHDGRWLLVTEQVMANGYLLMMASDITEKIATQERLNHISDNLFELATIDSTTSVNSSRHFDSLAHMAWKRAQRQNQSINLTLFKLDCYELLQEKHGKACANLMLKTCATSLTNNIRPYDILGRINNDTFALLILDTEYQNAVDISQRLCNRLAGLSIEYHFKIIGAEISFATSRVACVDCDLVSAIDTLTPALSISTQERMS